MTKWKYGAALVTLYEQNCLKLWDITEPSKERGNIWKFLKKFEKIFESHFTYVFFSFRICTSLYMNSTASNTLSSSSVPAEPLLCKFADGGQKKRQNQNKYIQNGRAWHREGEVRLVSPPFKLRCGCTIMNTYGNDRHWDFLARLFGILKICKQPSPDSLQFYELFNYIFLKRKKNKI